MLNKNLIELINIKIETNHNRRKYDKVVKEVRKNTKHYFENNESGCTDHYIKFIDYKNYKNLYSIDDECYITFFCYQERCRKYIHTKLIKKIKKISFKKYLKIL